MTYFMHDQHRKHIINLHPYYTKDKTHTAAMAATCFQFCLLIAVLVMMGWAATMEPAHHVFTDKEGLAIAQRLHMESLK